MGKIPSRLKSDAALTDLTFVNPSFSISMGIAILALPQVATLLSLVIGGDLSFGGFIFFVLELLPR